MSSTCETCAYASWKQTGNGDKTGRCAFDWRPPPLPKAFSLSFGSKPGQIAPPLGGYIERGAHAYKDCLCYVERRMPCSETEPAASMLSNSMVE